MTSLSGRDDSATLKFVAGVVFMIIASAMFAVSSSWFLIGLNAVVGLVLFIDGGRRLAAAEQSR